jgi:hypothetical protein
MPAMFAVPVVNSNAALTGPPISVTRANIAAGMAAV